MKTAIRTGLFSPILSNSSSRSRGPEPAESSVIQIGRKRLSTQRFPPAKRFCPVAPTSASQGVTKESPSSCFNW